MRWMLVSLIVIAAVSGVAAHDYLTKEGRFSTPLSETSGPIVGEGEEAQSRDPRLVAAEQCDLEQVREISRMAPEFWARMDAETADDVVSPDLLANAEAGDRDAMMLLAFYYAGRTDDEAQAQLWLQRAADAGIPAAQNEVGYAHAHALYGFEKSPQLARQWLERALEQGDAIAAHTLGDLYLAELLELPPGTSQSARQVALDYYLTAAAQCYCGSLEMVSQELQIGRHLDRDPETATEMLRLVRVYQAGTNTAP